MSAREDRLDDPLARHGIVNGRVTQQKRHDFSDCRYIIYLGARVLLPSAGKLVKPADDGFVAIALATFELQDLFEADESVVHGAQRVPSYTTTPIALGPM